MSGYSTPAAERMKPQDSKWLVVPRPVLKNIHSAPIRPLENQLSFEYSVTGSFDLTWK